MSCSVVSFSLGEPIFATASEVSRWILLEQPGPWGREALEQSRLAPAVARELAGRAKELGIRVLLISRFGRSTTGARTCFLGCSGPGPPWLEGATLCDPAQILDADLEALARGERPGLGSLVRAPLYTVCTNSARDACCAAHGRPLARALSTTLEDRVWQCSHVGGHRFAANMVCFPHGLYFGRVGPKDGMRIVSSYEDGRIELAHYRGRSAYPADAQAAEFFVREREGISGVDDLALAERRELASGEREVSFGHGSRESSVLRVRVRKEIAEPARRTSCGAREPDTVSSWSLVSLERLTV